MKDIFSNTKLIIIILTLLLTCCTQVVSLTKESQSDYDFTPVDDLLEDAVETIPLEGCVLLLIKNGVTIYEKSFGRYTLDTVVPIASATKLVSAVLMLDLVDDGLVSLDDKVSE